MAGKKMFRMGIAVVSGGILVSGALIGCSTMSDMRAEDTAARAATMLKASFVERGQAKLDRLDQDDTQRLCTEAAPKAPSKEIAQKIEQLNLASIKWPGDGNWMGDWKNGEKIAQEGRGLQYSDDPTGPVGANCYACHQLTEQEVSFGTIGPSLYQFAKLRGYGSDIQKYAYGKVYNAEAYAACTNMPRFGHKGILTPTQIRDVVALLMDPESPVNK